MIYAIYYDAEFHQYKCKYKNYMVVIDMNNLMNMNAKVCPEYLVEHFYNQINDDIKPLYYEIEYYEENEYV